MIVIMGIYISNKNSIPGFTPDSMTTWDVTKLIKIQNAKTKIELDTVKLVNVVESLLESAAKVQIPSVKFQGAIWVSPFDKVTQTYEGSPEKLLKDDNLLPAMLDFDVLLFLQEEQSVREAWNKRNSNETDKVEDISSTGSFHGDSPSPPTDYNQEESSQKNIRKEHIKSS